MLSHTSPIDANVAARATRAGKDPANCGSKLVKKMPIFGFPRLLRRPCRKGRSGRARGVGFDRAAAQDVPKRMETQVNEIRGADPFQGDEECFRREQHGREPGARGSSPDEIPREDARCRPNA
jgi:hypothetical protein